MLPFTKVQGLGNDFVVVDLRPGRPGADAGGPSPQDPEVVRAMLDAIPVQESPMVQIALIDMLVQLKATGATPGLVKLSRDKQVIDVVQQRAAWAVQKLEAAR